MTRPDASFPPSRELVEARKLIQAGWESWRHDWIRPDPDLPSAILEDHRVVLDLARSCFYAGALHASTLVLLGDRETAESVIDELKATSVLP